MSNNHSWLIYHPRRKQSIVNDNIVYHDSFSGNQDPYIWNSPFLHSFCHITQLSNKPKQINFWVSRNKEDKYPYFTKLYCDLVFVIGSIHDWAQQNSINREDEIIDNDKSFKHHYNWVNPPYNQHHFKGSKQPKKRYTLKAEEKKSFQPQDKDGNLIDIIPFLEQRGLKTSTIQKSMTLTKNGMAARPSRPYQLNSKIGQELYEYLRDTAIIKLTGHFLADKHPKP